MTKPTRRISILFHIVEFNEGGIESSLLQWLKIYDRREFDVSLSVMFTSPAFENHYRALIPADVKLEMLVDQPWLNYFQARRHANQLGKPGRVARDVFNSLAVRPYVTKRLTTLARQHDVIVDFDMSLRRWAGRFDIAWLGVNHFSFDARLGHRPRKAKRLARQYARYDAVVALNAQMAAEATSMFGDTLKRLLVLPNAIDVDGIRASAKASEAPRAPCSAPYIVSVARLDEYQKDHGTLLQAYSQLLREVDVPEHLVLAGDGGSRQALQARAAELGIAARVHFVGHVDNPHALVAGASLFVLSSRFEGMPMGLLEALTHGKPIVATDCPTGPRDILDNGRFGILVPVGDTAAMTQAFRNLLTTEALRHELSSKAFARAQYYGIEESNKRFAACVATARGTRGEPGVAAAAL